jgi:hypothetical protein
MKQLKLSLLLLVAIGMLITSGCIVATPSRVVVYAPPPGEVMTVVVAPVAPPPPRVEEVLVAPAPGHVWIEGHWAWHDRWVWVPGRWVSRPHPQASWVPGHWTNRPNGYEWVPGHWRHN